MKRKEWDGKRGGFSFDDPTINRCSDLDGYTVARMPDGKLYEWVGSSDAVKTRNDYFEKLTAAILKEMDQEAQKRSAEDAEIRGKETIVKAVRWTRAEWDVITRLASKYHMAPSTYVRLSALKLLK